MRRPYPLLFAFCIVVFPACGGDSGEKSSGSKTIDPSGGTISVKGASLDVPEGALYGPTEMSVARTEQSASLGSGVAPVGDVYEFGPENVPFNSSVTVTLSFDEEQAVEGDEVAVWWSASADGPWENLGGKVDWQSNTVSVEVRTMGFGVVGLKGPSSAGQGGSGGEAGQSGEGGAGESGSGGTTIPEDTPCDLECMSQPDAFCCTGCGCEAEVQCEPVCDSPYVWDCEIECCFDRDIYECVE